MTLTMRRLDRSTVMQCIDACLACASECALCVDACLTSSAPGDVASCVRANLDCADICLTLGRQLSRHANEYGNLSQTILLRACVEACLTCADECEQHVDRHPRCRSSADRCVRCARACQVLLGV